MIRKLKSIQDTVKVILEKYPETRDNDRLLTLKVWAVQNPNLRSRSQIFVDFATDFFRGSYADTESIRRTRQKIQADNPHLKGDTHLVRKELAEEVRTQIHEL